MDFSYPNLDQKKNDKVFCICLCIFKICIFDYEINKVYLHYYAVDIGK